MIDLSDEEDEVQELKPAEKMGKVSSRRDKEKTSAVGDSDDVCVVGEVSKNKYPRGLVLGPPRLHEAHGLHISNIRRRKRIETNSSVKYVTIRRNICSSFRNVCLSSVMRRNFFNRQAVRLEERKKYMQLIQAFQSIMGYGMIVASCFILRNFEKCLPPHVWQTLQNYQPQRNSLLVQSPNTPIRCGGGTRPPIVECVDLDYDSDNDIVEVPQGSKAADGGEWTKSGSEIAENDNIIDLEQGSENECSLLHTSEKQYPEIVCGASTSTAHSEQIPDADETYINLVDDEEEEDEENVSAVPYLAKSTPKGNLADQLVQQMIINDDDHVPVEIEKPSKGEVSDDELEESLPEITHEMQILVYKAFKSRPNEVLVDAFNLEINGRDIQTLKGNNWLNDQVINFYMSLLMERGKLGSYPSVYCFNTFFFVKLVSAGHASLKRWTRMVDLFSYDMLMIPIHMKVHWCLAAVNFIEKRIEYYDSMHGSDSNYYGQALLKYLQDEHLDKKREEFNTAGWEIVNMKDIPEQLNGCDCGVFACTYAEYICRLAKLTFKQEHMPYFRVKMAYEILTKKLLL